VYNSAMELANLENAIIRLATEHDKSEIYHLIQSALYSHVHVDWHLPVDWLGEPGFVVCESPASQTEPVLTACFAAAADPLPAAWVRLAAIRKGQDPKALLEMMLAPILPYFRSLGVTELGWFPVRIWPESWLFSLGFEQVNQIVTFIKNDINVLDNGEVSLPKIDLQIRPAVLADMPALASLEDEAFDPLWRHSANSLTLAYRQASSFDLAELDGQIIGFQYSVDGQKKGSVHLVRITVAAEWQNQGVGSALLNSALNGYRRQNIRQVTLNTQIDNISSHRLYQRFGFRQLQEELPVWSMRICEVK
jgi:ribosomal protein S18 acetylase RimI-like enzyme